VDESTFNDERGNIDLPDGLVNFRMNLVELLVDICQILRSATFLQKVPVLESMIYTVYI
jgi:transportin-3